MIPNKETPSQFIAAEWFRSIKQETATSNVWLHQIRDDEDEGNKTEAVWRCRRSANENNWQSNFCGACGAPKLLQTCDPAEIEPLKEKTANTTVHVKGTVPESKTRLFDTAKKKKWIFIACFVLLAVIIFAAVCLPMSESGGIAIGGVYIDWHGRLSGWRTIDGNTYYFIEGKKATGQQIIDGSKRYFDDSGFLLSGWHTIDNSERYFNENGEIVTGWQTIAGDRFRFEEDGEPCEGWKVLDGVRYFFESGKAVTGWKTIEGAEYFFENDGAGADGWTTVQGRNLYFLSGELAQGWRTIEREQYWFEDGVAAVGWRQLEDVWYYFEDNDIMATGYKEIGDCHYVFDNNGKIITDEQVFWGETDYYLGADGKCTKRFYKITTPGLSMAMILMRMLVGGKLCIVSWMFLSITVSACH